MTRNKKIFKVTKGDLHGILSHYYGLPDDAVFLDAMYDDTNQVFKVKFSHPDFPEVPEGATIPIIGPGAKNG